MEQSEVEKTAEKLFAGTFTMDDMLMQFEQVEKMGPMKEWLSLIPGLGSAMEGQEIDEGAIKHAKAIIQSMTTAERHAPDLVDGPRRRRIARGSGTSIEDVNKLLKSHKQMQQVMKQMRSAGGLMGKMTDRRMMKMKQKQLAELRSRGVSPAQLGLSE
jgi:signal recognition particle subunit SRP54